MTAWPAAYALIAPGELLHVPRVLTELLVELELPGLRVGRRTGDEDLLFLHLALRLGELAFAARMRLVVLVAEVDVELADLEDADADVVEVRAACATKAAASLLVRDTALMQALALVLAELAERRLHARS